MSITQTATPVFSVTRIIKGFEFGHGSISGLAAKHEVLQTVNQTIQSNPKIIVPIDTDDDGKPVADDGCGDGREVLTVFSLSKHYKRSLNRPKVFGGSATMATACLIGMGQAEGKTLNDDFEAAIKLLDKQGMDFGAHTDERMHGKNCGCGAIDKAPEILLATLKYELPIRGAITVLVEDTSGLNEVYANFRNYVLKLVEQKNYSGMQVMDTILQNKHSRVVKQLGGNHRECAIVLNTIRNFTVNQKLVRDATNNEAQIFGVDVWRMQDIATKLYEDNARQQQLALLSELIYTVATAAVLTKGDLPVDVIQAA